MELRDLFSLDVEALTPVQAEFAVKDIITTLTKGGLTGVEQNRLKTLLVAAKRKELSGQPQPPDTRTHVQQLIEEAKARGDARAAQVLADSLAKVEADALANEKRKQEVAKAQKKFIADDIAARKAALRKEADFHITTRTADLLSARGNEAGYDEARARKDATQEVVHMPAFRQLAEAS